MTQPAEAPITPAAPAERIIETVPTEPTEAPAPEATPEAEPAKEPTPEAERTEKLAKRFEAAKQNELRARKATTEAQALMAKAKEATAEIEKTKAELESTKRMLLEDPVAALSALGVKDMKAWLARAITPASEEAREIADIKRQLAEREKRDEEAKTQSEKNEKAAREHQQFKAFVSTITPDAQPYTVARFNPEDIPGVVKRVLEQHGPTFREKYGRKPTADEVREYIERESQEWASEKHRAAALPKIFKPQLVTEGSDPKSGNGVAGARSSGSQENGSGHHGANGPRTLTNDHAAQAATGRSRPMTKEERKAALIAQLEAEQAERQSTG